MPQANNALEEMIRQFTMNMRVVMYLIRIQNALFLFGIGKIEVNDPKMAAARRLLNYKWN